MNDAAFLDLPPLGRLVPDEAVPEWWVSEPLEVPLLGGRPLRFTLDGLQHGADPSSFGRAADAFLKLSAADRAATTSAVYDNLACIREAMRGYVGRDVDAIDIPEYDAERIWEHVSPTEVVLVLRDELVYVQICAECAWEPEHGLQIVYRSGVDLCHVGQQGEPFEGEPALLTIARPTDGISTTTSHPTTATTTATASATVGVLVSVFVGAFAGLVLTATALALFVPGASGGHPSLAQAYGILFGAPLGALVGVVRALFKRGP